MADILQWQHLSIGSHLAPDQRQVFFCTFSYLGMQNLPLDFQVQKSGIDLKNIFPSYWMPLALIVEVLRKKTVPFFEKKKKISKIRNKNENSKLNGFVIFCFKNLHTLNLSSQQKLFFCVFSQTMTVDANVKNHEIPSSISQIPNTIGICSYP
jgi:hypothetical protein